MVGPIGRSWETGSEAIRRTLKRAKTPRRITPDQRLGIPYEAVDLQTADGVRLDGWFVPGDSGQRPDDGLMVVMHHHYGGQKATLLHWIELFRRLGIPSIAFDARGHAGSDPSPPGRGSFPRRAEDVRAAYEEARRRGATRILGFGQSQGAAALVISLAPLPDVVGCIVESGPAPDMFTAAWGLAGNMLGAVQGRNLFTRGLLSVRIIPGTQPVRYLFSLWRSLASLRSRPLLWLHGGKDEVIRSSWAGLWFARLSPDSGAWRSEFVPDAEHVCCLQKGGVELEAAVQRFIDELEAPAPRSDDE